MRDEMADVVTALHAAVDQLLAFDLAALSDEVLLDLVRDTETAVRRMAPVQQVQTAEVDRRGLAHEHGCASTSVLLAQLLRLPRGEARARVAAADALAPRRSFTGEVLPARYPTVAAAQVEGDLSDRHASLITTTLDKLPAVVDVGDTIAEAEGFLVEQARIFTPEALGKMCRHLTDVLDPDGSLSEPAEHERRRSLTLYRRADGTVAGSFEGTTEFGECLGVLLDVFAAPRPASDGTRDLRTAMQRQHDGLLDAMRMAIRSGGLPTVNGVLATVILTMTAEQWDTEHGLALTGHGALVPVAEAKRIAGGETRVFPVVFGDGGDRPPDPDPPDSPFLPSRKLAKIFSTATAITAYGTSHRLFTQSERLAMTARDRGCSFPGCTAPPAWCEADHVTDWFVTSRTSVDDGHLVCPFHHRERVRNGWTVFMRDGLPHWTAPAWLDPAQTPQRNRAHDPAVV